MSEEKSVLSKDEKSQECSGQDAQYAWCGESLTHDQRSMNSEERRYNRLLWVIVDHYPDDRLEKLREETEELFTAIDGAGREDDAMNDDRQRDQIVNEMVDVQIMIDQVRRRFNIGQAEWDLYKNFKIHRQLMRIDRS